MIKNIFRLPYINCPAVFISAPKASLDNTNKVLYSPPRSISRFLVELLSGSLLIFSSLIIAAPLDGLVPTGGLVPGGSPSSWEGATYLKNDAVMEINQNIPKAILNWQNLNLANGETLNFNQASASWSVLNRIGSDSRSLIDGNVNALGHVYFINSNGIVFGSGAQINVGSLTASSLNITDILFKNGVLSDPKNPSFSGTTGYVQVDVGANLNASEGGRIMLLAPNVSNSGVISTPEGQTILAAGQKVYLASSSDPAGLLVEVSTGGTVTNVGDIISKLGNVTMVGLAVNQHGRISASTSVRANGSIRLLARESSYSSSGVITAQRGGVLTIAKVEGSNSDSVTKVDAEVTDREEILKSQLTDAKGNKVLGKSNIDLSAGVININGSIVAHGGDVTAIAKLDPFNSSNIPDLTTNAVSATRIYLGSNASIDVSGLDATAPMSRNQLAIQLYSEQLKDTPLLRGTDFLGKTIYVDALKGTNLIAADALEAAKSVKGITISEVMSKAGSVKLDANLGDMVLNSGSKINVSGGTVSYEAGFVRESQLLYQGKNILISEADKNTPYEGFADVYSIADQKWGVTRSWDIGNKYGEYYQATTIGSDAGSVNLVATDALLQADLKGFAKNGLLQRDGQALGGSFNFISAPTASPSSFQFVADNSASLLNHFSVVGSFDAGSRKFNPGSTLPKGTIQLATTIFSADQTESEGGFTRLNLDLTSGNVFLDASVNTAPKGNITLKTTGAINVNANIISPGGAVTFSAGNISFANNIKVSTSGIYTNDTVGVVGYMFGNVVTDAGSIKIEETITNNNGFSLGQGVRIEANAGAWLNRNNQFAGGKGGDITLTGVASLNDAMISAYGFNLGGSLSLSAYGNIQSGGQPPNPDVVSNTLWLPESFFGQGGFNQYTIQTRLKGSSIMIGDALGTSSIVHPKTQSLITNAGYRTLVSGNDMNMVASPILSADFLRNPASINFNSQGTLTLANNAKVILDNPNSAAVGRIVMDSKEQMTILGSLIAPAGSVTANLSGSMSQYLDYDSSISLFIGPNAILSTAGNYLIVPSNNGLIKATVSDAGNISLNGGARAVVVLKSGSLLDVSGASGDVDVMLKSGYARQKLFGSAGSISITARNGIVLDGDMKASASGTGMDGSLNLTFLGDDDTNGSINPYPNGSRVIEIVENKVIRSSNLGYESSWADMTGLGVISSEQIYSAGIGRLTLQADRSESQDKIILSNGLNLQLQNSLTLNSSLLEVADNGIARIGADYFRINGSRPTSAPSAGISRLDVNAKWIDLIGNVTLSGVNNTTFTAEHDIRGRGITPGALSEGSLLTSGILTLTARQIYPVTNGFFRFQTIGDSNYIQIKPSTLLSNDVPLSAGGTLSLYASNITQGGSLLAPLGQIVLEATNKLTVKEGSLTSVSAGGHLIPYGLTRLGGLELQAPNNGLTANDSISQLLSLPEKKITIKAPDIEMDSGATINISGGGDTLAYEWINGIGGSIDILHPSQDNPSVKQGVYAILPNLKKGELAPFDYNFSRDNLGINPGDSIHLSGVSGLADGDYLLLPGRYALMPGAFIVEASTKAITQSTTARQVDGSTMVSTYKLNGNYIDTTFSAFKVTDASIFHATKGEVSKAASEYRLTYGNQFFTKLSQELGFSIPRLSSDAGQLVIDASKTLGLDAKVLMDKADNARGGLVDIASNAIKVVSTKSDLDTSVLQLTASSLNNLNAESILLGGTRSANSDGSTQIITRASSLEFSNNNQNSLSIKELIAASNNALIVSSGASITNSPASGPSGKSILKTNGPGALLAVSSLNDLLLERIESPETGTLTIAANSNIFANRSMILDSRAKASIDGQVGVDDLGTISLGAGRLTLGDGGLATDLKISNSLLSSFGKLSKATLNSYKNIDIYGPVDLGSNALDLTFNAGAIAGHMSNNQTVKLSANNMIFKNSLSAIYETVISASGSKLLLSANNIELLGGSLKTSTNIAGFETVQLDALKEISVAGDGIININASNVSLKSARISAASAANFNISVTGALKTELATSQTALADVSGIGAKLTMTASELTLGGEVDLPGGQFVAKATTGNLTVSSAGQLKAKSVPVKFDKYTEYSPAGSITLQTDVGNVVVDAGGLLDVSGKQALNNLGGDAGSINIISQGSATFNGNLQGLASSGNKAASFVLDTNILTSFSLLNTLLNTGEFKHLREMRIRSGDITIGESDTITAEHVIISADAGSINLLGTVDARGSNGGKIEMYARDYLTLENGAKLLANANGDRLLIADKSIGKGGTVFLSSLSTASTQAINAKPGSMIDVSGDIDGPVAGEKGKVILSAYRGVDGVSNTVNVAFGSTAAVKGAREVRIEGVKVYDVDDGVFDVYASTIIEDTNSFYEANSGTNDYISTNDSSIIKILPSIEVRSRSDLNINEDLNIRDLFGTDPKLGGTLSLRSYKGINLNGSLSDGFSDVGKSATMEIGNTYSYNIVAGADFTSANLITTVKGNSTGNFYLAPDKLIRTGEGQVNISTSADLIMGSNTSAIYTVGVIAEDFDGFTSPSRARYLTEGGDLNFNIRGNIFGKISTPNNQQIITSWLFRQGGGTLKRDLSWWVRPDLFAQGVAALGGGNVIVNAGGNITDFSVSVPTTARYNKLGSSVINGGGDVKVTAGGNIYSGIYFAGKGNVSLNAGESIMANSNNLATMVALQDASVRIEATKGVTVESVFNPTLWMQTSTNADMADITGRNSNFISYGQDSAVKITSLLGDITYGRSKVNYLSGLDYQSVLEVSTPTFEAIALKGNINYGRLLLAPSSSGNIVLLASESILPFGQNALIGMSNANSTIVPTILKPVSRNTGFDVSQFRSSNSSASLHLYDYIPAIVVAQNGSISFPGVVSQDVFAGPGLALPKAAYIRAGQDALLYANIQNIHSEDISIVSVGRDLNSPGSSKAIKLGGPGELLIKAGRHVSLGISDGISTVANTLNSALPSQGASVTVLAGLGSDGSDMAGYVASYINPTGLGPRSLKDNSSLLLSYRSDTAKGVASYMSNMTGNLTLSEDVAMIQYLALDLDKQSIFAYRHFSSELLASGKGYAESQNHDRGDNAIASLFPSDRTYKGDLSLYNSQIRTSRDGSVDILTPGGLINAGVPTSSGKNIGIVTERGGAIRAFAETGFQVEQSKIITQYGSDITVWVNNGDIDAGRGSKTALSVPQRVVSTNADGKTTIEAKGAAAGSGIRAQTYDPDGPNGVQVAPPLGSVALIAPRGVLNASEAGIAAGNFLAVATVVLGANNITVTGTSSGVPVASTGSVAGTMTGVSNAAADATKSIANDITRQATANATFKKPMPSLISVEVIGLGE